MPSRELVACVFVSSVPRVGECVSRGHWWGRRSVSQGCSEVHEGGEEGVAGEGRCSPCFTAPHSPRSWRQHPRPEAGAVEALLGGEPLASRRGLVFMV